MVRNANALKEGIKPFILTTLIRLDDKNFPIERIKNFGFMMNEINPYEFAEVINEANIVLFITEGINSRVPDISLHEFK
jgi:hypothetical protein